MISIGIAPYPQIDIPNDFKGGDSTVNNLIKEILTENGYIVEFIPFDLSILKLPHFIKSTLLRPIIRQIFIPILYSKIINKINNKYDLLICDSGICFNIKHPKCINLFHYSFKYYKRNIGKKSFLMKIYFIYDILSTIQYLGSRKTINVAVSNYLKKSLEYQNIVVTKVINNAINLKIFKPMSLKTKKIHLLYAGGYSYYGKGIDILEKISSYNIPIDCFTNIHKGKKLNFQYNVPYNEMPNLYNKYTFLVFPSRYESCGIVPLEAMACGLPVIMSNVGVGESLRKEIPEFVVEGFDKKAVLEYISKINLIKQNYQEYSRKARNYVEKYHSLENFKKEWNDLVKNIINTPTSVKSKK